MAQVTIKNTGITVTCNTAEELYTLYRAFNAVLVDAIIINGEELMPMGKRMNKNCAFGGYTRSYFEKYFR